MWYTINMTTQINGKSGEWYVTHVETKLTVPTGTNHPDGTWRDWPGSKHNSFKLKRDAHAFKLAIHDANALPDHTPTQDELIALRNWVGEQLSA